MTEATRTGLGRFGKDVCKLEARRKPGVPVVGYIPNGYMPVEMVHACGAEPVALFRGGEAPPVLASTPYLGRFVDPFCRAQIGYRFSEGAALYKMVDLLVVPITDQHNRGIADSWHFNTDVEVFELGIPKAKTTQAFEYYREGLNRLKSRLEALTGNEITGKGLREAIRSCNRVRDLLKEISLLRMSDPPPISGKAFIGLVRGSFYEAPDTLVPLLEKQLHELKDKEPGGSSGARIFLTGATLADGDDKVVDLLEEAGASIVIEDFCEGIRDYWEKVDPNGDPIDALADHYILKKMPGAFFRGASKERFGFFADLIKQFRVNGVVWYSLLFRETYDIEGYLFGRASEFADLPKLMLKSNYDAGESETLRTRIETFMTIVRRG